MPVTNCKITRRGHELNDLIAKFVGKTQRTLEICSLVARHATTHHRLQEIQCNREATAAELLQERNIEARIRKLVADLPQRSRGNSIAVKFQGDPRGYTVKLVVPGDNGGNTWGLGGEYGV
ncbi:MAG TPA: hypothetical protein VFZ21_25945 [Gemmatimonadaceae bacterium]|nr:hypothetical protein [Gemmatimonadaceae bacterium]